MRNHLFTISILLMLSACDNEQEKAQTIPIKNQKNKEILLIGTLHYDNPGADVAKTKSFDILSEKSQSELQNISANITAYNPTKIFVEWPYDEQKELDSLYQLYKQSQYFTNKNLSNFYKKNEIFQLAFRIAEASNHEKVFAIDYSTSFPFEQVMKDIKRNHQSELSEKIEKGILDITSEIDNRIETNSSLTELTYYINEKEFRTLSNNWHNNLMLLAGGINDFSGPELTAEWFKRNLYMWSLIQKHTADTDERILVLVGGSHAAMIDLFVQENENWDVKELKDLLKTQ